MAMRESILLIRGAIQAIFPDIFLFIPKSFPNRPLSLHAENIKNIRNMKKEVMMKTKSLFMLLLAGVFTFGLQSCDDDDDKDIVATPELQAAFTAQFPNVDVNYVKWEWNGRENAYEADFYEDRYEKSAWFSQSYEWMMTETDYNPPYSEVPQVVQDAAQAAHPDYRLDDIDGIETPGDMYYRVEMEKGERDIYLNISPDGTVR